MARGINKVILVGNLGKDPETRYMPNGKAVTNFSIATSESWKDKQTGEQREQTEWHNIVMYDRLAEIAAEYLKKGSQVYVEGKLRTRKWQDKEGRDRYTTEINANEMQMLGGRAGAGIASELGSMQVTEQVDAIRAMGADPVQKLVMPRVVATTLGLPFLTIFAITLGIVGGMLVSEAQYGIDSRFFLQTVTSVVRVSDFASGVAKTLVFGWAIGMVGCTVGLATEGGTVGVGRATTRAVVLASIVVLVADFFLTKLLLLLPTDALVTALARLLAGT